ncbi:MAG: helix-turn-helix domain-containing protein [Microcoleus sp. PH2017_37_MFU_D_B]|nr:helix-turn-helix domain-containing protein [Microcoleus sp. PH2017_37_MFU_D_B]
MSKHAGIVRFTYNWGLATWSNLDQDGLKPNKYLLKKFFNNHVKPEFTWIKEAGICQKITQYAFDNLDSFTIDAGGKPIPVGGTSIKLPTIGWVKT